MKKDAQPGAPRGFVPRVLPWLLGAVALTFYILTLNHWVSLLNINYVARIAGWTWQPEAANPVSFLVTLPFRWLPTVSIPFALNLFSAVCAALTLLLLARSVVLMPHDRTSQQRELEHSDFSILTIRNAWLPPVFAVLVCGLQTTFLEQATNFTNEMFELLLFAFVIWSLLEYRIDERKWRLSLAAFVYGAGMAENWAMIGFFPVFVTAIVWICGLGFFKLRFLVRTALFGLAGLLFYLLLPLLVMFSSNMPVGFWQVLKFNLANSQGHMLKLFLEQYWGWPSVLSFFLLLLPSLIPVFIMAIRWQPAFGDNSRIGGALTGFLFNLIHAVFLVLCVWMAFDPPFSPRHLGFGVPFLTFYYLGALSVGYYSGYFLLVFGPKKIRTQRSRARRIRMYNYLVVAAVWLLFAVAVTGLAYKNIPQIRATNDDTLQRYASLVQEELPANGCVLLSDDPERLFLIEAMLAQHNELKNFVPLDTSSLIWPSYHHFLHKKFPQQWPDVTGVAETNNISPLYLISLLATLTKTNELYYLHPSFGYYFEEFYLEPHDLIYKLKILPKDTLLPPLQDKNQIDDNETFWAQAGSQILEPIVSALTPPAPNAPLSFGETIFKTLHISREQNLNDVAAGALYSRDLNFWGVELQRAGELDKAVEQFAMAKNLNPDNIVAEINLDFNKTLRDGKTTPVDLSKTTSNQFGKYRSWVEMLDEDGPFDEPSFCFENGTLLAQDNGYFRQAIAQFARVCELVPDNLPARLWLARLYVSCQLPDPALKVLHDVRDQPERFPLEETNESQLNLLESAAYFQKTNFTRGSQLLETEISRDPTNNILLTAAMQVYVTHGLFANALGIVHREMQTSPDNINLLLTEGYINIQLKNYDAAVSTLSRVLDVQTNNANALFNRAIAYLDDNKLDKAKTDYLILLTLYPNSFQAAYGLGEIASRNHETNDAVKYYELYLANANTNTDEAKNIIGRLRELKK